MLTRRKHRATIEVIFVDPVRSKIRWSDIVAMLTAAGAELNEGRGSRVRISPCGVDMVIHRPHSRKETDEGAVKSMRRFFVETGLEP